jgi:hypothetical protein
MAVPTGQAPPKPATLNVWDQLEADCLRIYSLPHNVVEMKEKWGKTPAEAARHTVNEVKSGLGGSATRREFTGPRLFLRVVGPRNQAYSGSWWFDADLLHRLDAAYARIYFQTSDRKAAIRDMLRELLAITTQFNPMLEVYALALPQGERLVGYVGRGASQPFSNAAGAGNRMLVGQAEQVFFPPAHSPFWVTRYTNLRS